MSPNKTKPNALALNHTPLAIPPFSKPQSLRRNQTCLSPVAIQWTIEEPWKQAFSPSSGKWQSSQWWRTTCGPWCRWLRCAGFRSAWSGPPGAGSSAGLSSLSWSGRGIVPGTQERSWALTVELIVKIWIKVTGTIETCTAMLANNQNIKGHHIG